MSERAELHDLVLEQRVLGSCIIHPDNLLRYTLTPDDFYAGANQLVWNALLWLAAEGDAVDTTRLRARLIDTGHFAAVGGDEYLLALTDTIPDPNLPIERLQHFRRLRALEAELRRAQHAVASADLERTISVLADAHSVAMAGQQKSRTSSAFELCETLLDEMAGNVAPPPSVHPGYAILEQHLGSLPVGTTTAVLATTNVGKSTYTMEMLLRSAQRGECAGYVSVEDQAPVVRSRWVGLLSGVSSRRIIQRRFDREDFERIARGMGELHELRDRLHTSILQGGTELDVCAAMSELAARGCKLIAVDYLQKIRPSHRTGSRAHEVSDVASRITSHAQKLGVACVLVSQCTRDKTKANACPSKHDMKESGDLENMVDAIVALWRTYEDDFSPIWARLLKVKWGGVGTSWRMERNASTGRLDEVEGSDKEAPPDARDGDFGHRWGGRR